MKKFKVFLPVIIILFWIILFIINVTYFNENSSFWKEEPIWKLDNSKEAKVITKEDYLKEKNIQPSIEFKSKVKEYNNLLDSNISIYKSVIFLWVEDNKLYYQISYKDDLTELKEELKTEYKRKSLTLDLTDLQEKILQSKYKKFDFLLLWVDNNWTLKTIDKLKENGLVFSETSKENLFEKINKTNQKILVISWLFTKKYETSKLEDFLNKLTLEKECSLNKINNYKKIILLDKTIKSYIQKSCDNIVYTEYNLENWNNIIDTIYLDHYYSDNDRKIVYDNYTVSEIETNSDSLILNTLYYELWKKYPLIFF